MFRIPKETSANIKIFLHFVLEDTYVLLAFFVTSTILDQFIHPTFKLIKLLILAFLFFLLTFNSNVNPKEKNWKSFFYFYKRKFNDLIKENTYIVERITKEDLEKKQKRRKNSKKNLLEEMEVYYEN